VDKLNGGYAPVFGSGDGAEPARWPLLDWELIAESIPHIVWMTDPDGSAEYVNRRGAEYFGCPPEALQAWDWVGFVHPDEVECVVSAWKDATRSQDSFELEYRMRRADGSFRWQVSRGQAVRGPDNSVVKWIGTITDIDDKKRLRERLDRARRRTAQALELLQTVLEAAPVGFAFINHDARFIRVNEEMAAACNQAAAAIVGRPVVEVLPGIWEQCESSFRYVFETGQPIRNVPVVGLAPYNRRSLREWLTSYYPIRIGPDMAGVGLVAIDVTARMRAERVRAAVLSQITDGVYTVDADGRLTSMNRAAATMLGWTEAELRGRPMHETIHFQTNDGTPEREYDCFLRKAVTTGHVTRAAGEWFTRKDGSVFRVALTAVPLRLGSSVEGVAVIFRDLTPASATERTIRVLVASADSRTVETARMLLDAHDETELVHVAPTATDTVAAVQAHRPDVALVDYDLPDLDGLETVAFLRASAPSVKALLLAEGLDDDLVLAGIDAGCNAVLDKRRMTVELMGTLENLGREGNAARTELPGAAPVGGQGPDRGKVSLTERESEVLVYISEGLSNRQVAEKLGLTVNTVRNHVQRILYKLNVHSKLEAVLAAQHVTRMH